MLDKIEFPTNVPVCIELKYAEGKTVKSPRFGNDEVLFSVIDQNGEDRVWYAEPFIARRIADLGIGRGEPFEVCRAEVRNGARKAIEWRIRRLDSEPPAAVAATNGKLAAPPAPPAAPPANANGNAHTDAPAQAARPITKLEGCLRTAIAAAQAAERYGESIGYSIRFAPEHIKSMAVTLLINGNEKREH